MSERTSITSDFHNQLSISRSNAANLSDALNSYHDAEAVVLKLEGEILGYQKQLQDAVVRLKTAHTELNFLLTGLSVSASETSVEATAA
jgi:hypothetical protein